MTAQPSPSTAAFSHEGRQSATVSSSNRHSPSTALLIEYYENVANKGPNMPSVRVRVNPYISENQQQSERTSYVSPLPTRENTVIDRQRGAMETEDETTFGAQQQQQGQEDTSTTAIPLPLNLDTSGRGRQRTRAVSGQQSVAIEEEEEEPLPAHPFRIRDISDPQSLLQRSSIGSNDIVSTRQFQQIIASAIQELILPEIQAVRNELTAQAQLFNHQPGLNQVSNQATFGTSTSGRKRSRSLTALDAPLHRRNSLSIGTTEGYHADIVPLPPRPQSPNVPAAMEAESLLRADLRSELKMTPPGTATQESRAHASHRLSELTDAAHVVADPSTHTVFNLAEGAYRKRESQEERMAQLKARRAEEKRLRGENLDEGIPEDIDLEEPIQDKTRFSVMTGDHAESSIHDLMQDQDNVTSYRDREVTELKSQLDNILEHLKSSAADRSGRETDILAQISVLAENTHRSLQQLKDTILEETNVCVGALSYNIERHVTRVLQGPRPLPDKSAKGLGKSASYPQDRRTIEAVPPPGPVKRTTTFLQGIGHALTPAGNRASKDAREGMERLETMMQRVLEEVEMLKRMKQGARRKTNGEMFKGDLRSRLNPPDDAVIYIDEVRGDAANRERGESEEERMARIERSAKDFEEEKNKRVLMQEAIATETNIFRQTSKEVRAAQAPLPTEYEGPRLPPLRMEQLSSHQFPQPVKPIREGANDSPSADSYAHGDETQFTTQAVPQRPGESDSSAENSAERARMAARVSQVQETSRKISIKDPVGLPSSRDDALPSGSARESGVLGEHLEGDFNNGHGPPQSWIAPGDHTSNPPTPISKDEAYKRAVSPAAQEQQASQPGPSRPTHQRTRSQYFVKDQQSGRREYYLATPDGSEPKGEENIVQPVVDKNQEVTDWSRTVQQLRNAVSPRKNKDKGKGKEVTSNPSELSLPLIQQIPIVQQTQQKPATPLPSLFAATQEIETSPGKKLRKKTFRKPITTPFEIKESPVATPHWSPLGQDMDNPSDELRLDSTPEKKRRSWKLFSHKAENQPSQQPQEPATLARSSLVEPVTLTYPGPSQEVKGRNGFHYNQVSVEDEQDEDDNDAPLVRDPTQQSQQSKHEYRGSMSDSMKDAAIYNMRLGDELAKGRHPASFEVPPETQWTLQQQVLQEQQRQRKGVPPLMSPSNSVADLVVPGPFARRRLDREFTPTPPILDPMPSSHLIPEGLLSNNTYGPTQPLSTQKLQSSSMPPKSFSPSVEESLYDPAAIRQAFKSTLERRPTPPRPAINPARGIPRLPNNLPSNFPAEMRRPRRPSTLKEQKAQLNEEEHQNQLANGSTSPSKTESSYKTANDVDGEPQERSNDGVRPPSLYSHDSIGGGKFSRNRARTPPDTFSISSADFSSSTRPLDPSAPAKYSSPPRSSPRNSPQYYLNKPNRVPSGPRVAPPNFANTKAAYREDRYSRPSIASDFTRPTSEDTEELVVGTAVKTDLRNGQGTVTANWLRSRRLGEAQA